MGCPLRMSFTRSRRKLPLVDATIKIGCIHTFTNRNKSLLLNHARPFPSLFVANEYLMAYPRPGTTLQDSLNSKLLRISHIFFTSMQCLGTLFYTKSYKQKRNISFQTSFIQRTAYLYIIYTINFDLFLDIKHIVDKALAWNPLRGICLKQ